MPPWVASKDFSQVLETFGIAEIETVDLTGDDPASQASLPSMSLPLLEAGDFDDESPCAPQSPRVSNSNSAVSTRHVSPADLLDTTPDEPRSSEYFHVSQSPATESPFSNFGEGDNPAVVGSSCDVNTADAQLDAHPDVSKPSSPRPDTEDTEAAAASVDSPAHIYQKHLPTSPQPPRYPRVVIPTGFHARNPPTLDVAGDPGSVSVYARKRHCSADAEHETASPAKQQRVSLQPSTRYNYRQSTVSAVTPPTQIQQQAAAENAHVHDNTEDKGSEGDDTGFVRTAHEESGREPR
ncbi:hypothetical protein ACJ73_09136 [Blastomyces percursus]|uniref:Uncharacterized protein n=1 Tax=Blastomyces percursus TaxID=1658174 RepID=A0A1J9QCV7_9EURO|nr:hypothetical protein ACJ73_09136 [Blastomyces percursus]